MTRIAAVSGNDYRIGIDRHPRQPHIVLTRISQKGRLNTIALTAADAIHVANALVDTAEQLEQETQK